MRQIYLIRHAKSSWELASIPDIDRPLNQRGLRDAKSMAKFLNKQNVQLDALVVSPAKRALMTANFFVDVLAPGRFVTDKKLYLADTDSIYTVLFGCQDGWKTVGLIGHNPGFTMFANLFAGKMIENVPTTGIVHLESTATSWQDVDPMNTNLLHFWTPKKMLR
ncbi:MAG: histidine phosphatase family protein [Saprospiraceae bacterium]|nr:histidine phosphatase family protein [Saprospiraceae bacterium]